MLWRQQGNVNIMNKKKEYKNCKKEEKKLKQINF